MNSPTFVVVDTETGFGQLFEQRLQSLQVDFLIDTISPLITLPAKPLVGDIVTRIKAKYPDTTRVAGFLVDLVVHEDQRLYELREKPAFYDTVGIQIARNLRIAYPHTPIFIVTEKISNLSEQSLLSEASLEDVDGVFAKHYITGGGFSGDRLDLILSKASTKRRGQASPDALAPEKAATSAPSEPIPSGISIAGSRATFDLAISECGPHLWSLIHALLGEVSGSMEALQPGRSGAVVFRINAKRTIADAGLQTEPKNWIIKAAHDRNLIEREIRNYSVLKSTKLDRSAYPQLLTDEPSHADGLWGIAQSFDGDVVALGEFLRKIQKQEGALPVARQLSDALRGLYSTDPVTEPGLWSHYWDKNGNIRPQLLGLLKDIETVAKERNLLVEHKAVDHFIQTNGESCPTIHLRNGDQFETRWIHGDLNSGNVLVSPTSPNGVLIIDFASAGKGHVVKDFAKLERDVYFRVIDGKWTAGSSDWGRMKVWMHLASVAVSRITAVNEELTGNELAMLEFIRELRRGLVSINSRITVREYSVALIYYSLTALLLPELSLQKRLFGIWFVSELLKRAEYTPPTDLLKDWANLA